MNKVYLSLLVAAIFLAGCGAYTKNMRFESANPSRGPVTYVPLGIKKERKRTMPSVAFTYAIKDFKLKKGYFPQELRWLDSYTENSRSAMADMREWGYEDMRIEYLFLDSMVIRFDRIVPHTRKAIYTDDPKANSLEMHIPGRFIFVMKDSSMFTRTLLD